jgi:hypothetical protein
MFLLPYGGHAVNEFRRSVFCEGVWRATLATLVAVILMICFGASATGALLIGANVALIFAFAMMLYAGQLTDERRARERDQPETTPLRFAQGGAGVAIAMSGSALVI